MAITIQSQPSGSDPTPVSGCLEWCLLPAESDVLNPSGSFARVTVNFPATIGSIPPNGTEITIWGHVFTVDSTIGNSTATKFKVVSSGNTTGANFRAMLNANGFFLKDTAVNTDGVSLANTVIDWLACGEQQDFTGAAMDLAAITAMGGTFSVTNGVTPETVNGYMMQVRLLRGTFDTSNLYPPVTPFTGIFPFIDCDAVNAVCVDMMPQARRFVWSPMPDLTSTSEILPADNNMTAVFLLNYGWSYRDANCQPLSGDFATSYEVFVLNAAFAVEDKDTIARIWTRNDTPPLRQHFLTTQPKFHTLGENSFHWLWLLNSFSGTNYLIGQGTGNPFTLAKFRLVCEIYAVGSAIATDSFTLVYDLSVNPCLFMQVMCFNVSPARIADLSTNPTALANIGKYTVYVDALNSAETEFTRVTEELTVGVEHACENLTDMYFTDLTGGIVTILGEVTEKELVQEANEICLDVQCSDNRQEIAKYGGRIQANVRSFERVTWRARRNYTESEVNFFRNFKASPERWIQTLETTGGLPSEGVNKTYIAKRFLVDTGGVRIFQSGDYIELVVTGYTTDIPLQSPRNSG